MHDISNRLPAIIDDGWLACAKATTTRSIIIGDSFKFLRDKYPIRGGPADFRGRSAWVHQVARFAQQWQDNVCLRVVQVQSDEEFADAIDRATQEWGPGDWQPVTALYVRDPDSGADFTFLTSSKGGQIATRGLAQQTVNMQLLRPGAVPIVRFDVGSFPSKKYGDVPCPAFTVIGWVDRNGEPYPPIGQPAELPASPPVTPAKKSRKAPKAAAGDAGQFHDDSIDDLWGEENNS